MVLLFGTALLITSCKKSGSKPPPSSTNNTGCLITKHTYTGNGPFEGSTVYHYDANNQITSFELFNNTYGTYPARKDMVHYSAPGIVYSISTEFGINSDHHIPDLNTSEYADPPTQEMVSYKQGGDYEPGENPNSPLPIFNYTFIYDDNHLTYIKEEIHDVKMDIYYNNENNVSRMVIEPLTGPRGTTTITVSAYDNKHNPYSNIPYWKLIRPDNWIQANDEESLLTALSQNNPMDFTLVTTSVNAPTYTFSRVMTYTYNDKGLPITRNNVQTQTGQAGSSTYSETFEYNCK